jgi:hypothetical protein
MAVAAFVLSVIALLLSSMIALRQLRLSEKAMLLPVMVDVLREFRSSDFKRRQTCVYEHLLCEAPSGEGFDGLPPEIRADALFLSHFYDNVGLLTAAKVADWQPLVAFLGGSAVHAWKLLGPYIEEERKNRKSDYQQFFEDFVACATESPPSNALANMRLRHLAGSTPLDARDNKDS